MKSNQIASVCRQSAVYTVPDKLPDHLCGSRHLLKINGQPCFIYQTEVTCGAHYQIGFAEYASFDLYGKAYSAKQRKHIPQNQFDSERRRLLQFGK